MPFNIIGVVEHGSETGGLYPIPATESNTIQPEALDGSSVRRLIATDLLLLEIVDQGERRIRARLNKIRADVVVTDARVAIACSKYDKGGGWHGTSIIGVPVANAASKIRAASRRRGKTLVGHTRYSWLKAVGYQPASASATNDEMIRLEVATKEGSSVRRLFLDLYLPRNVDSASAAQEIVHRTARFRLTHHGEQMTDDEREQFLQLTTCERLPPPGQGKVAMWFIPTFFYVSTRTAYPSTGPTTP